MITQLELRQTADALALSLKDLQASRASSSLVAEQAPDRSESQRAFLPREDHMLPDTPSRLSARLVVPVAVGVGVAIVLAWLLLT